MRIRALAGLVAAAVLLSAACDGGGTPERGATTAPTGPTYTGVPPRGSANPLGAKFDLPRADTYAPYLRRLTGGSTFSNVVWCDVERRPGSRKWADLDRAARLASRLGLRLALRIRIGSCWATGGQVGEARGANDKTASAFPTDLEAYTRFVEATVARARTKGVHDFAVENEVNAETFWQGTTQEYVRLVEVAAKAIRQTDPEARVFDSGISSTAYGAAIAADILRAGAPDDALAAYKRYYGRRFPVRSADFPDVDSAAALERALAAGQPARNDAFLSATFDLVARGVVDAYQVHFYERWDNVEPLLRYLRAHVPARVPIEAWEVGMFRLDGPVDTTSQATEIAKLVASLLAGGVQRIVYLPTAYNPAGRRATEMRWALLEPSGRSRPGAELFARLAAVSAAASATPVAGGRHGVVLARSDESSAVVWADSADRLAGPPPAGTIAVDPRGRPITWGRAGLALDQTPVVITVPGGPDGVSRLLNGH
jgi:hypothetical protein